MTKPAKTPEPPRTGWPPGMLQAWLRRRAWMKAWRAAIASGMLEPHVRAEYERRLAHAESPLLYKGESE